MSSFEYNYSILFIVYLSPMKLIPNKYFLQDVTYDMKEVGKDDIFYPSLIDIKQTQQDLTKNL